MNLSHVQEGSEGDTWVGGPDSEELAEETAREPFWERPERGLLRVHFFCRLASGTMLICKDAETEAAT